MDAQGSSSKPEPVQLRVRVTPAAEKTIRQGHPWVFAESIREQNRAADAGEFAVIYDRNDRFLAIGLFDAESPIRIRILHAGKPQRIDAEWWQQRLARAVEKRSALFGPDTTGFRYINGESDGWPGLVLDRYDQTFVLKLYTSAWLGRLQQIVAWVEQQLKPQGVVLRLSRNIQDPAANLNLQDGQVLRGAPITAPIVFLETGLSFEADVVKGQKTGFFLDQRENRRRVSKLGQGRAVLNTFSFSGGFSVYAARGGARSVTDLDLSAHALAAASRNFALNRSWPGIAAARHETIQAEAFAWLDGNQERVFDLIILDPPSLARREAERQGAIEAYRRLVTLALGHLGAGGILVACSCSAHVSAEEFFDAVRLSAERSGREWKELARTGHAADHPAMFKEAEYLKAIYLAF